jgi:hypothetical protein
LVYGLLFVLLLLLLAAALPTAYSFHLLSSLNVVMMGISTLLSILWLVIIYPVIWLLSLLLPPAGQSPDAVEETQSEQALSQVLPSLPQGVTWEMVVREILFWGVVVLILVYLLRQVFPLRYSVLRRLSRWFLIRRILEFLRWLRRRWSVLTRSVALTIQESWEALREDLAGRGGRERGGFLHLGGLDPRQSVRFYFFAMLRRGAESGIVRHPAQTPREYVAVFSEKEAEIGEELREMTAAFEEARYTMHPVTSKKAKYVRRLWDTIRSFLRSSRQREKTRGKRRE